MLSKKILNFKVRLYSKDAKTSPILDYISDLLLINKEFGLEAILKLRNLPQTCYLGNSKTVKIIKQGKFKCYELRVIYKKDICRFFFVIEEPSFIVIHGFTKKTQKTDKKALIQGEKNLKNYYEIKCTIGFDY